MPCEAVFDLDGKDTRSERGPAAFITIYARMSMNAHLRDPAHGGLITHCWVPDQVVAELRKQRFQFLKVLGDDYPRVSGEYTTDWYYYVFSKSEPAGLGETCD